MLTRHKRTKPRREWEDEAEVEVGGGFPKPNQTAQYAPSPRRLSSAWISSPS
jgi:hypothetical protein